MTATVVRLDVVNAMVVRLQTINATGLYTANLSLPGAASSGFETREQRMELGLALTARVSEGAQRTERPELNSNLRQNFWECVVDLQVQGDGADTMDDVRKKLNQAMGDVSIAVGTDETLGSVATQVWNAATDQPGYDPDQRLGWAQMRFVVEYHNQAGLTI